MRGGSAGIDPQWLDELAGLVAAAPVNLVSRRDRADVRGLHVDECVAISRRLSIRPGSRWMDLGTGGGLPGLVLARAFPLSHWTLVDARGKKIALVRSFAAALALDNVEAVHARAEDLALNTAQRFDGVISRAAGSLLRTALLARPFVSTGEVVAIRGPKVHDEVSALADVVLKIGLAVTAVDRVDGTIRPTWLVRLSGQGPVPQDFPRTQRALLRADRGGTSDGST